MDEALLAAYRASTYLVCLDTLRWLPIHLDEPLPAGLQTLVGEQPWAFITAWNPHSVQRSVAANTAAQQQLLATLRARAELAALYPGVGIGSTGWYEPSLFVVGLAPDILDALCTAHGQNAYVHGRGQTPASLRWLAA